MHTHMQFLTADFVLFASSTRYIWENKQNKKPQCHLTLLFWFWFLKIFHARESSSCFQNKNIGVRPARERERDREKKIIIKPTGTENVHHFIVALALFVSTTHYKNINKKTTLNHTHSFL